MGTGHDRYNCADFSHDLVVLLRKDNITSYPMCGWLNHSYHAWVGVELETGSNSYQFVQIEPQTGQEIYPSGLFYANGRRCVARGLN